MKENENGTNMSDLDIAEAFLMSSPSLQMFCTALGVKFGTEEYVRRSVTELRAENARLTAELATARGLLKQMADCNPWNDSPDIPVVDYAAYTNAAKKSLVPAPLDRKR